MIQSIVVNRLKINAEAIAKFEKIRKADKIRIAEKIVVFDPRPKLQAPKHDLAVLSFMLSL